MPKWKLEYTLPGERGKIHTKSGDGNASLRKAQEEIQKKGGKIKSVSGN